MFGHRTYLNAKTQNNKQKEKTKTKRKSLIIGEV